MTTSMQQLAEQIRQWGYAAGFQQVGFSDVDLSAHADYFHHWLTSNYHGEMDYMQRHADLRVAPEKLQEGALRSISFRMDYYPDDDKANDILASSEKAFISRYALGRDYHKLIRKRLSKIAQQIQEHAEQQLNQRAFVDSAPVLERALAEKSNLGWIGKNTMLINPKAGSYFFLGEILTDLPLPTDEPDTGFHCGSCTSCLDKCPTDAFVGPNQLDARKCISYLTIELKSGIPEELRSKMGNRVFGCDDCQMVCPWNKFTHKTQETDFHPRHQLEDSDLLTLFLWDEDTYLKNTEGSAIRRIGYQRWLRNLAVGLGNAPKTQAIMDGLKSQLGKHGDMVDEHIQWALKKHALDQ